MNHHQLLATDKKQWLGKEVEMLEMLLLLFPYLPSLIIAYSDETALMMTALGGTNSWKRKFSVQIQEHIYRYTERVARLDPQWTSENKENYIKNIRVPEGSFPWAEKMIPKSFWSISTCFYLLFCSSFLQFSSPSPASSLLVLLYTLFHWKMTQYGPNML